MSTAAPADALVHAAHGVPTGDLRGGMVGHHVLGEASEAAAALAAGRIQLLLHQQVGAVAAGGGARVQ
ncbi:hypothetical protein NB693_25285 [Pantoea ananatis]|nr:hypothetical protein [Pantoea ananatis]